MEMIQLSVAFFAACVICSVLEACEKAFMGIFLLGVDAFIFMRDDAG